MFSMSAILSSIAYRKLLARWCPAAAEFIAELGGRVKIDIAYAGSCTAGKKSDMDMYARVFREALERGERVHADVKCYIQCGSQEVKRYCEEQGYLEAFGAVGAGGWGGQFGWHLSDQRQVVQRAGGAACCDLEHMGVDHGGTHI